MKRFALVVLLSLGAWDCNLDPSLGCGSVIIGHQELDFERACEGDSCSVTTLGSTTTVPSLLPGDHARALFRAASLTWTLAVPGNGEGTSLGMSYRCDEDGSLRVELEGSGLAPLPIEATPTGQRSVWPLQSAPTSFSSMEAATAHRHQAVARVTNTGNALCAVDWLRYVAAPRVCGNSGACSTYFDPPQTFCDGTCADTLTDRQNCGGGGNVCPSSTYCEAGRCVSGSGFCLNACYEIECGPNRCGEGSCGTCPTGRYCASGRCYGADAGPRDVPVRDVRFTEAATVSRTSVVAGRRCNDEEACVNDTADLVCTALPGGRVCTNTDCEQGTRAQEEGGCGGLHSTCLVVGSFTSGAQASACTRACIATASTEATAPARRAPSTPPTGSKS